MPILDKIKEVERENFDLEKKQFELERSHHNKMIDLKSIHSTEMEKLQSKIVNLESEIHSINSKKPTSLTSTVERG